MDMGFSLRSRNRDHRSDQADRLGSLLANVAARQSLSPTARIQTRGEADGRDQLICTVAHFAPDTRDTNGAVAFHPGVADRIVTHRQQT
jgi:hypothetical protein